MIFHRWSGTFVLAIPADSGLYQVLAIPELSELPRFRQNLEESYLEYVRRCDPVAQHYRVRGGSASCSGCPLVRGFFREATGPGWALAGDAGHFKDPAPGQGIQDSFRQVEFRRQRSSAQSTSRRPRWTRRSRAGRAGAMMMLPSTTGSPPTSARRGRHLQCYRRSHSVCTSGASWTRSRTCSTIAPFPQGAVASSGAGRDSPLAGAWRLRPASVAGRGKPPHRPGHSAETPGPASALRAARGVGERRAN